MLFMGHRGSPSPHVVSQAQLSLLPWHVVWGRVAGTLATCGRGPIPLAVPQARPCLLRRVIPPGGWGPPGPPGPRLVSGFSRNVTPSSVQFSRVDVDTH
jgi:hypothetical protein